jgi:hypothetical protein
LRNKGFEVLIDYSNHSEYLSDAELGHMIESVYLKQREHCVILMRRRYLEDRWMVPERQAAFKRAFAERGSEYFTVIQTRTWDAEPFPEFPAASLYLDANRMGFGNVENIIEHTIWQERWRKQSEYGDPQAQRG